jgi:hypothetical protein
MLATHHLNDHLRTSDDSYDAIIDSYAHRRPLSTARSYDALDQVHSAHKPLRRSNSMLLNLGHVRPDGPKPFFSKANKAKAPFAVHADAAAQSSPYPLDTLIDSKRKQKTPSSMIRSAFGDLTNKYDKPAEGGHSHSKRQSFSGWAKTLASRTRKPSSAVLDQSFGAVEAFHTLWTRLIPLAEHIQYPDTPESQPAPGTKSQQATKQQSTSKRPSSACELVACFD